MDPKTGQGFLRTVVVTRTSGKGRRILTGGLGSLFKEAARVAITLVGVRAEELVHCLRCPPAIVGASLELPDWDIHVSLPGSDTKKEGTSAGLCMAIVLVALMFGKDVVESVAFTGEIDLKGDVLPVAEVEKKLEGAHRLGLAKLVIPAANYQSIQVELLPPELQAYFRDHVYPVSNLLEAMGHGIAGNNSMMQW